MPYKRPEHVEITGTPQYPLIDCRKCKRPTRHPLEKAANAPGTLARYGANGNLCHTCRKKKDVPTAETAHAVAGLNAWLADRNRRLGQKVPA